MSRIPKGFRDISTTYQRAFMTLDGNVQLRQIGRTLWEILPRGGSAEYAASKEAGVDRANQLTYTVASRKRRR